MTKDESKRLVLREWDQRMTNPSGDPYDDMREFYSWLVDNRPELLRFRTKSGDRWHDVQGWLKTHTNYGRS